jgi:hypothetical protein
MPGEPDRKPAWGERWPEFVSHLEERLADGDRQYGGWSFGKPHTLLVADLTEELLDIVGWGYILYCRLMDLSKEVDDLLERAAQQLKEESGE